MPTFTNSLSDFYVLADHLSTANANTVYAYLRDHYGSFGYTDEVFSTLNYDTVVSEYDPAPDNPNGFGETFLANYRYGNWTGGGYGAGRYTGPNDPDDLSRTVAARDVFDSISRNHDLEYEAHHRQLQFDLAAAGNNLADRAEAYIIFHTNMAETDADFSEIVGIATAGWDEPDNDAAPTAYQLAIFEMGRDIMAAKSFGHEQMVDYISKLLQISSAYSGAERQLKVLLDSEPIDTYYPALLSTGTILNFVIISAAKHDVETEYLKTWLDEGKISKELFAGSQTIASTDEIFDFVARQATGNNCFPAGTLISMADGSLRPIETIRSGDAVMTLDHGRLATGIVDKTFTNTAQEFIRLTFADGRDPLTVTPGHRFLCETGDYMEIGRMVRLGGGKVRLTDADGTIVTAQAEHLEYSAATAAQFERSQSRTIMIGNTVLTKGVAEGWQTYNFEVASTHNYVAGGVRVHNDSILSLLQDRDVLVSLDSNLDNAAVARNVNGGEKVEMVLLDGRHMGNVLVEYRQYVYTAPSTMADPLAAVRAFIDANEDRTYTGDDGQTYTVNLTGQVFDPGHGNGYGDGVVSDDMDEVLVDDLGFVLSAPTSFTWSVAAPKIAVTQRENPNGTVTLTVLNADGTTTTETISASLAASIGTIRFSDGSTASINELGVTPDGIVHGTAGADLIDANYIDASNDYLSNGNDQVNAGGGNDTVFGYAGNDALQGEAGNDTLAGGFGNDTLNGGAGSDTANYGGTAAITVNLGGTTAQTTGQGSDQLIDIENVISGSGNDTLFGNALANALTGNDGADSLVGGSGDDTLEGGNGNDTLMGGADNDRLDGGGWNDSLDGGFGNDTLIGGEGQDTLNGGSDSDALSGDGGHDALFGGNGSDTLVGGLGNDTLDGGGGSDSLTGDGGEDYFLFVQSGGADVISDFSDNTDTIEIADIAGVTTFAQARTYATQNGNHVVFDFGGGDTLTIHNTTINALADDMVFV